MAFTGNLITVPKQWNLVALVWANPRRYISADGATVPQKKAKLHAVSAAGDHAQDDSEEEDDEDDSEDDDSEMMDEDLNGLLDVCFLSHLNVKLTELSF